MEFLIFIDKKINALLLGDKNVTVSGRVGLASLEGSIGAKYIERMINFIFCDKDHCYNSIDLNYQTLSMRKK